MPKTLRQVKQRSIGKEILKGLTKIREWQQGKRKLKVTFVPRKDNRQSSDYVLFAPEYYVDNPVALARIKANLTQTKLAKRLHATQAYIRNVEKQEKVTPKKLLQEKH